MRIDKKTRQYFIQVGLKVCPTCGYLLEIEEFSKNKSGADGLSSQCKECKRKQRQTDGGKIVNRKAAKKYGQTDEGRQKHKISAKRYGQSPKGKVVAKKYSKTNKGKAAKIKAVKKYSKTIKGKITKAKAKIKYYSKNPSSLRSHDPQFIEWAWKVKNKAKFTCRICGDNTGGNLNSHHKNSWDKHPDQRYDINNGICLCEKCHKEFHKKYGHGNNTIMQYLFFKLHHVEN